MCVSGATGDVSHEQQGRSCSRMTKVEVAPLPRTLQSMATRCLNGLHEHNMPSLCALSSESLARRCGEGGGVPRR